jgi:16S rRNA (cytosine1402-N4)-methyltransferase
MKNAKFSHIPVLLAESAKMLITDKDGIYLDATLGLAGHSKYFSKMLGDKGRIIGLDKDKGAIKLASENLRGYKNTLVKQAGFEDVKKVLNELKISALSGVFYDLGLSSYQLDNAQRGFSFTGDGPLDMRFDDSSKLTAKDIVNKWPYEKIAETIKNYGQERFAFMIAQKIVEERRKKPIETTGQLRKLIEKNVRRTGRINPATRTFQAIRIAVNDELGVLKKSLQDLADLIIVNGRVAVISYHSLEDRLVKHFFKKLTANGLWKLVNKKPITPLQKEVAENPKSRSAKLRVVQRIR